MKKLRKLMEVLRDAGLVRYYFQRKMRGNRKRDLFAGFLARTLGRKPFEGTSRVSADRFVSLRQGLRTQGYVELGRVLDAGEVQAVKDALRGRMCYDAYEKESDEEFALQDAPPSCHTAYYRWQDVVRIPMLMRVANDPLLLNVAQSFLGGAPTISDIKMWWSLVTRTSPKENQLFHRDIDDFRFCKLFLYLTDVGPQEGPHVYVQGSAGVGRCLADRRFNDEEVATAFGRENVKDLCGPAGSAFLVNTYGVHKGLMPTRNSRLIFVVQYSLLPIGLLKYAPVTLGQEEYSGFDPYVNRLFLRRESS